MAATLRPETMYGQTNAWVLPEGKYGAFRGLNGEIYVLTERSARNLSYQVCGWGGVTGGTPSCCSAPPQRATCRTRYLESCFLPSSPCPCTSRPSPPPPPSLLSPAQENTPIRGQPECLMELTGQDLIGVPVRSPNATHDRVYVLPLLTILTNKGTGVVTSVPSDSPDDYMALQVREGGRGGG